MTALSRWVLLPACFGLFAALLHADHMYGTGTVASLQLQVDGKLLVGGDFTRFGNTARNYVARLHPSGVVDSSFNPGTGANAPVSALLLRQDGSVVVGGAFNKFDGVDRRFVVVVDSAGQVDTAFDAKLARDNNLWSGAVHAIAEQFDGKLVLGGRFDQVQGQARSGLARVQADGTLDSSFVPADLQGEVLSLAVQPDGRIVVGGTFQQVNGGSRKSILRLHGDGAVDTSFQDPALDFGVACIQIQFDGKLLLAGYFSQAGGVPHAQVVRLNADGSVDSSFQREAAPGLATQASKALLVQPDGKVAIGTTYRTPAGPSEHRVTRLLADGALDHAFAPVLDFDCHCIAIQPDLKLLIGGLGGVIRVNQDGSLDTTFNPGPTPMTPVYHPVDSCHMYGCGKISAEAMGCAAHHSGAMALILLVLGLYSRRRGHMRQSWRT